MMVFALLVAWVITSVPPDYPPADALRFGMSLEMVQANRLAWQVHLYRVIREHGEPQRAILEQRHCEVGFAWQELAVALDPRFSHDRRNVAIRNLHDVLSDEAFYSGWLPPVIPPKGN